MIPNSDNTGPLAVTLEPDWGKPVSVTFMHATGVFESRSGKEQRTRSRRSPKARITWSVSGLSTPEANAILDSLAAQGLRLSVVPFWTEGTVTVTSISSNAVTIAVDPRRDFFAAGQFVYLDDGTNQYFREIASVSGRILTLVADGSSPAFGSDSRIWPCRICRFMPSENDIEQSDEHSHDIKLTYETTE